MIPMIQKSAENIVKELNLDPKFTNPITYLAEFQYVSRIYLGSGIY